MPPRTFYDCDCGRHLSSFAEGNRRPCPHHRPRSPVRWAAAVLALAALAAVAWVLLRQSQLA